MIKTTKDIRIGHTRIKFKGDESRELQELIHKYLNSVKGKLICPYCESMKLFGYIIDGETTCLRCNKKWEVKNKEVTD